MIDSDNVKADEELTNYVLDYYRQLCTKTEDSVLLILNLEWKSERSKSLAVRRKLAEIRELENNVEVQKLVSCGRYAARRMIRERLLNDYRDTIFLNYCPKCSALCRTPLARMCVACGHSWYENRNAKR